MLDYKNRLNWRDHVGFAGGRGWGMDYLFWFSVFFLALIGALYIFGVIVRAVREWMYWRKMGV